MGKSTQARHFEVGWQTTVGGRLGAVVGLSLTAHRGEFNAGARPLEAGFAAGGERSGSAA